MNIASVFTLALGHPGELGGHIGPCFLHSTHSCSSSRTSTGRVTTMYEQIRHNVTDIIAKVIWAIAVGKNRTYEERARSVVLGLNCRSQSTSPECTYAVHMVRVASVPAVSHAAPIPAKYAAPTPIVEYIAPTLTIIATSTPLFRYIAPTFAVFYLASAPFL